MSPKLRTAALVLFFVALAALEIAHGLSRLGSLRERRLTELRSGIERRHAELARDLATRIEAEREHAAFLARSPGVRALLATPERADRRALEAELIAYLSAFGAIDRVSVLDASGVERLRCERIGGGVGALPDELLDRVGAPALLALAANAPVGGVAMSGFSVDAGRVEVVPGRRQVLHFAARIAGQGEDLGALVLTLYAAPLVGAVRDFAPLAGVESRLVDAGGRSALDGERVELDREDADVLVANVLDFPPLRLATLVPDASLERELAPLRGDYAWILATMVATTLALAAAAAVFLRLSSRAFRLREAERDLERLRREREMEEKLRTSERLTSLGLLTAGVAHEINNPLEGIGNYLTLLGRPDLPQEKRERYLELVRHGFQRIRDIVRDLLTFARPGLEQGSADLAGVVARAQKLASYSKACENVRIEVRGLDAPLAVPGDAGRLEQVVLNLLLNAGAAMGGQGRVVVTAAPALDERGQPWVELGVEDEGPGIAEADLSRIFDPFFTTTGGTGLGLSISFGIVRAHGGLMSASNRVGGGARFVIGLPAGRAESTTRQRGGAKAWHGSES